MKADKIPNAIELRRQAEARLKKNKHEGTRNPTTLAETQRLLYELQVHQIELEMQNEELMRSREEVEELLRQYTDLYDFAKVGYFTLDRIGTIHQVNLTGAQLLGQDRAQLINSRFGLFICAESLITFNTFLDKVFESHTRETCEIALLKEGDESLYVDIEARVTEDAQECRVVAVDITARKLAELQLVYLSIHDALTGLYNRGSFEEDLARLERGRQFPISIMMADLDQLKAVNDNEGHAAGDTMLKRVAQVLTTAFRAEDIIARIGGDEFAVLLPNTDKKAAEDALSRLKHVLQEHNAVHAGPPVQYSFGVSTAEQHRPLMDVLREADEKMYLEKRRRAAPQEKTD
ncbi:MAG: hypothetical protein CVU39_15130 [Chloroflexi bacterium HGW-Chloroflexi-10]|nr:MAG: hypothetical protein CVU39_15130 [Chloroflexi bacterium HGW-Chloroflexi-10]